MVACVVNAQPKGIWDYPVKQGTDEWKRFQRTEEMVNVCQIPEEVLSSLSTEDLTDLCLQYPLLICVFAFNNTNQGLDQLFHEFNGIRELFKRDDASKELLKRYQAKIQSMSFLTIPDASGKGNLVVSISIMEYLLSRYYSKNDEQDKYKEILQNLVVGYEKKAMYVDYFKGTGFETNFFSRAHVIAKMDRSFVERLPHKENNSALYSGMITDEQTVNIINELSYQLIK